MWKGTPILDWLYFSENTTVDYNFVNFSLNVAKIDMWIDNVGTDKLHEFGCKRNHFGGNYEFRSHQNVYIYKMGGTISIQELECWIIYHWKEEAIIILIVKVCGSCISSLWVELVVKVCNTDDTLCQCDHILVHIFLIIAYIHIPHT